MIAELPIQNQKRALWLEHHKLKAERPLVFISPDNSWNELIPASSMRCLSPLARDIEYRLRQRLIRHRYLTDDVPIDGVFDVTKVIHNSGWGIEPQRRNPENNGGSWRHVPTILGWDDVKRLKLPIIEYDEPATEAKLKEVQDVLDGILDVQLVGIKSMSFHMIHLYCDYRGMENMLYDLVLEPQMVHDVIGLFTQGYKGLIRQYEQLNLLSLNNDSTLHYTGGIGLTDRLPAPDFDGIVRPCDLWAAAEAQEFSNVSPDMHEEFILQYERELLEPFGINGYGCCDDLSKKLSGVLKIANLLRVAICPWANVAEFTPLLSKNYIMTWKPQPSHLARTHLDMATIQTELEQGITSARGGVLELILRDTNTCLSQPERFVKWTQCAYRAIENAWQ